MIDEEKRDMGGDLSCTFCGPGTWATWEVITEDGVVFVCDIHHVEMSKAKMILLERMRGEKTFRKVINYERRY
jgi:hypothetical protein